MNHCDVDLRARARRAVLEAGFKPDFSPEVQAEVRARLQTKSSAAAPGIRDLRALPWSSIDNDTSRDLDQVEFAEQNPDGSLRLLVGIADVDAVVAQGSAADAHAACETTSVYAGAAMFPMLPLEYSTDATSLLDGRDRAAMVVEVNLLASGEMRSHEVSPALIRNAAKLTYNSVGDWLEGRGAIPPAVAAVPGMEAQIRLQNSIAARLKDLRKRNGALTFASRESMPVLENGQVRDLKLTRHNAAEEIIENFMVAANVAMAEYAKAKKLPAIRRVVKTPKRWDRIQAIAAQLGAHLPKEPCPVALSEFLDARRAKEPMTFPELSLSVIKLLGPGEYIVETPGNETTGHFGLAVNDYSHTTAPNRRFGDLVMQRQLKAAGIGAASPYSMAELAGIAARCTEREDAAKKVERLMRKVIAASLLCRRVGEEFDGTITGASPKGTYVRLLTFPAEGMVVRGAKGVDVGDRVRVRLAGVDIERGFIDFERIVRA